MKYLTSSLIFLLALGLSACDKTYINYPTDPSDSFIPRTTEETRLEFRVNGNATSARIRYSNPIDGLSQVVTVLPYLTSVKTTDTSLFLSIEATPLSYPSLVSFPFLSVQIFVNGNLFREASSSEFVLNTISVSGNWRK